MAAVILETITLMPMRKSRDLVEGDGLVFQNGGLRVPGEMGLSTRGEWNLSTEGEGLEYPGEMGWSIRGEGS